ncbi:hypothetical protein [Catellatospora sp. NPDC049609]|uniref:hypothetical protein n=1 Tax=Catellatospora sp. NPDC049609 TaxID=3155505 RepID=UPI003416FA33
MFVQVIRGRATDPAALHEALEVWVRDLSPDAEGWLGSTGGVTADGRAMLLARFDSPEAARRNSERPEQDAWWRETSQLVTDPVFADGKQVRTYLGAGSDDAGFVQVAHGTTTDPGRLLDTVERLSTNLRIFRPELIGGTVVLHHDHTFTEAVYFTTLEQAREGEQLRLPPELQGAIDRMTEYTSYVAYYDLTDPWLYSPKT